MEYSSISGRREQLIGLGRRKGEQQISFSIFETIVDFCLNLFSLMRSNCIVCITLVFSLFDTHCFLMITLYFTCTYLYLPVLTCVYKLYITHIIMYLPVLTCVYKLYTTHPHYVSSITYVWN